MAAHRLMPLFLLALACAAHAAAAQHTDSLDLTAVGTDARWHVANRTTDITDINGRRALHVAPAGGTGVVWLDGYDLGNGTIDVDMLGRSWPIQGSFVGVAFRVVDLMTHDAVYLRPARAPAGISTISG